MGAFKNAMIREADESAWDNAHRDGPAPTPAPATDRLRLYQLPGMLVAIEARIVDAGGEIDDATARDLDALEMTFAERIEAVACMARQAAAEAEMLKAEESRMRARRVAAERREAGARGYIHRSMLAAGRQESRGDRLTCRVQAGPPVIRWTKTLDELPVEFSRVDIAPDLAKAREAFGRGELPSGFDVSRNSHLVIR